MTPDEVHATLAPLSYAQVCALSRLSGVPLTTLWKIRMRDTVDPRIGTVGQFMPHVRAARKAA
jgi:hypothetical protein